MAGAEHELPQWIQRHDVKHHEVLASGVSIAWTHWTNGAGVPAEAGSTLRATCRVLGEGGNSLYPQAGLASDTEQCSLSLPSLPSGRQCCACVSLETPPKRNYIFADLQAALTKLHEGDGACIFVPSMPSGLPDCLGGAEPAVQAMTGQPGCLMVHVSKVTTGASADSLEERNAVKVRA